MQRPLDTPSDLVKASRELAGMSAGGLARRAGVPTSTVTRVEAGAVDPTFTMLQRLLAAADRDLALSVPPVTAEPSLAGLASAIDDEASDRRINWTRLAGFADWARAHPDRVRAAIRRPPPRSGEPLLDNLLAGMAEELADDLGIERPRWCAAVRPLDDSYETPGTPRMREHNRRSTPGALADRNIFVNADSIWRDRSGA
jgi:transcriptional regulator with XRE-family HTH domain